MTTISPCRTCSTYASSSAFRPKRSCAAWALAGALNVSFSQLLLEPEPEPQPVQVLRVSDSPEIHGAAVDLRLLDRISARRSIELYEEALNSGSRREAHRMDPVSSSTCS